MEYKGLWQAVLGELEVTLSRANFSTWFKNTSILSSEDGHVIVAVPNIFTKEWLEKKYNDDIKKAIGRISGGVETIEYRVKAASEAVDSLSAPAVSSRPAAKLEPREYSALQTAQPRVNTLNDRYSFENFVVGSSNELAFAACQAVAKNPGDKYNPLFIYGGVGLGKTHLMQAVGNEVMKQDPTKRVEYLTSESFTNEFVSSISRKKTSSFTDKYRNVDVLIVDDMQFLAGKEKTQEEFFHTFNALHQANKQIIISSDRPPKAIATLEERLRSRFEWGMTADIQQPDLETRAAILQHKAAAHGVTLGAEVVEYMARNIQKNIRELEGALTQLLAYCELRGMEPDLEAAQGLMGNIAASRPRAKSITAKRILDKVAAYYDLSVADLLGARRDKGIVVPRQIAMYIMRQDLGLSFPKIAETVGGRDHTTAMHSVNKINKQLEVNEKLRSEVSTLRDQLVGQLA